jgi:ParB family chromosome partitioning protein
LAKSSARDSIKLTSVDELFSTEESRTDSQREKVLEIPLSEISDFPNHPFKVKADEAMLEMADSVKQYGVLVPALVRPKPDGGYEMVAGHRRKKASELAGKETMPCIVRELDDDEATIIMVDSNLQRESILPSEKAFAYKMKLEAMKRQAGRPSKENSTQVGQDLRGKYSVEILGEQVGESRNQIQRYIRLTELIPPILEMVDEKRIAFNPAVEISYLAEKEQQDLYNTIQSEDCTPSLAQAQRMKKLSQDGKLSTDVIYSILTEEKPNQKEKFHIQRERIDRFFPKNFTEKQKEDLIVQLLESWYKKRQKEQER